MGLIKTGLVLAGGYGLIKAASKAVDKREEKKQKRRNQAQYSPALQYHSGNHQRVGYMNSNEMNSSPSAPQWRSPTEAPPNYESHNFYSVPQTTSNWAQPQQNHTRSKK